MRDHGFDLDKIQGYYSLIPPDDDDFEFGEKAKEWWRARLSSDFNIRFIFLDTTTSTDLHEGGIALEEMNWLRGELSLAEQAHEYVVAFGHHNFERINEGANELKRMFATQPGFLGYFCGHTHKQDVRVVKIESAGEDSPAYFWQIVAPPIVEWPQSGFFVRLARLPDESLAWDLTPFTHPWRTGAEPDSDDPECASKLRAAMAVDPQGNPDAKDPAERLKVQVLRAAKSAYEDYHRGDRDEEMCQPPIRLLIPQSTSLDGSNS